MNALFWEFVLNGREKENRESLMRNVHENLRYGMIKKIKEVLGNHEYLNEWIF
jgi:hypothetical protein